MASNVLSKEWGAALIAKVKTLLGDKVDKVAGKGLSTNDLTTALKTSYDGAVSGVADLKKVGAEKNTIVGIKVNGTTQTVDSSRNVDLTIPTDPQIATKIEGKGYQTSAQVQSAIQSALSGVTGIDLKVVESLPTTGTKGVIYLVAHAHGSGDAYDEYVWVAEKKAYEKIGNTDVDLTGYLKSTDITVLTETDFNTMWGT